MSEEPKFSIIMASYNYAKFIAQAIESVINQTYKNWELIIVDDASDDNSLEIIRSYCQNDSRIKLYYHSKNKGLSKTLQLGINKASYDWIAFLESDDMFCPDYLEKKAEIISKEPNVSFIFNDFNAIGNVAFGEESHHKIFQKKMKQRVGPTNYKNDFYFENPIPSFSTVALKKELLKKCNYNSPIKPYLDWFLWGQISNKTDFYYIDKPLTLWRKHPKSYMNRNRPKSAYWFYLKLGFYLPNIYKKKLMRLRLLPMMILR